ncbi:DoxX family protein [Nonomuraea sp. LPB2021202275-12-8]|uniref:DoxX family protein n=1 Tax=Nonomuraea sp. LPB2021202275-12-8 TaxID=3120159 RepID=UPI00300CB611
MFVVIGTLAVALLVFRLLGVLGVRRFATWRVSAAHALAAMLVVTASAHFVPAGVTFMPNHEDMVRMVPPFVPFPSFVVYASGVLELLGAAGLVLARTRRAAGISLAVLFVLLLPANIYAAVSAAPFNGETATPLWLRIPEQVLYIGIALWAAGSTLASRSGVPAWQPRSKVVS